MLAEKAAAAAATGAPASPAATRLPLSGAIPPASQQQPQQQLEPLVEKPRHSTTALSALLSRITAMARESGPERLQYEAMMRNNYRVVPFVVPLDKATQVFTTWKDSGWFAPIGFSEMVYNVTCTYAWVPYYRLRVTVVSEFSCSVGESLALPSPALRSTSSTISSSTAPTTITQIPSSTTTPSTHTMMNSTPMPVVYSDSSNRGRKWREMHATREKTYRDILVCGTCAPSSEGGESVSDSDSVRPLFIKVQDWTFDNSNTISLQEAEHLLSNTNTQQPSQQHSQHHDKESARVFGIAPAADLWRDVEREVVAREKEEGKREMLERARTRGIISKDTSYNIISSMQQQQQQQQQQDTELKDLVVHATQFKGNAAYNVIYVPLYVIHFEYQNKRFAFLVNGQTGSHFGERPLTYAIPDHTQQQQQQSDTPFTSTTTITPLPPTTLDPPPASLPAPPQQHQP
eukprot:TRINITY_DN1184_c4_g1_i1.p1 TRINITY_DN1184_c4_g1~~TRINITY_DN1184_c4_g1_i1.p1  ORF type:complete len:460 (+),score=154.28 TRINITY_DN1184_c4_g1_i1:1489-2868(+)